MGAFFGYCDCWWGSFSCVLCECVGCFGGGVCVFLRWCGVLFVVLFRFFWVFINEFKRGFSPVKFEGLVDHLWSWHVFLFHSYSKLGHYLFLFSFYKR